jgi:putative transposase
MNIVRAFFLVLRTVFHRRRDLILENLALRQQLLVQQRTLKRPKLQNGDRCFWACLSRVWPDWKSALILVKPETVIKWHRQRFKLY